MTARRTRWLAAGLSGLTLWAVTVLPTTAAWTGDAAFGRVVTISAEEPVAELGEFWFAVGQTPGSVADLSPSLTVDGLAVTRNWWDFQGSTPVYVTLSTDRLVYSASDPELAIDVTPSPSSWRGWFDGGAVRVDADFLLAGYGLYRLDLHVAVGFPTDQIPAIGTASSFALDFSVHGIGPVPDGASGDLSGWDKDLFGAGSLLWSPGDPAGAASDAPAADDSESGDAPTLGDAVQPDEQDDDPALAPPVGEGADDEQLPAPESPGEDAEPEADDEQQTVPEWPADDDGGELEPAPGPEDSVVDHEHECEDCEECADRVGGHWDECDDASCPARQEETSPAKTDEMEEAA